MKICSKCKIEKELNRFSKDKSTKDGLYSSCKDCSKEYKKEYYLINKEQSKDYYQTNKNKIRNYQKEYNKNNKEKIKEYQDNNKEQKKEYNKQYKEINKDKIKEYFKEYLKDYYQNNKDKINLKNNKRRRNNIQFKLGCNLRNRLKMALKNDQKLGSAVRDLGCSINDLKWWLEFWFQDGMTWDNHGSKEGQWSIDHIIPLSKVDLTNRKELLKVCNYKNLQPMWHVDNIKKGNK